MWRIRHSVRQSSRYQITKQLKPTVFTRRSSDKTPERDVSNITNTLNELNDENIVRNISYRTTLSKLVEEMNRKHDQNAQSDKEMSTMAVEPAKLNHIDEQMLKEILIERYIQTHKIYNELRAAKFTNEQSDIIMELLLTQLQKNLNQLISNYSPTLDLENEVYLFQAAQQELKSEVTATRDSDLNLLVNSSILLKRSFQSLEDELSINYKLMHNSMILELNQFKHENNLHNKTLDLKNQELNNKIITDLVGELRSYTESLRWQLTRSALLTIFAMVFLGISSYTFIKNLDEVIESETSTSETEAIKQEEEEEAERALEE